MCTQFIIAVQDYDGESVSEMTIPDESMPLCGCWLFDMSEESWEKIKKSHEAAGNGDRYEKTKADAVKLNDMFRDRIFEVLDNLTYDQKIIIEKI